MVSKVIHTDDSEVMKNQIVFGTEKLNIRQALLQPHDLC